MNVDALKFAALSKAYCEALAAVPQSESMREFVSDMTRLLPQLYLSAETLSESGTLEDDDEFAIGSALDEDYYESIRRGVESLLGPDDSYLEVFVEDFKYSDTPIGQSIAEDLADIFQSLFNYLSEVEQTESAEGPALTRVIEDFRTYWAQKLANVMRPLTALRFG